MKKAVLKKLTWKDVRKDVLKVNSGFVEQIDKIDPSDEFILYKISYPFGSKIIQDGVLQLPNKDGNLVSANDSQIDEDIKENLSYTSDMPIGLPLNRCLELYWMMGGQTIPFILMNPGRIFSLWDLLQPTHIPSNQGKMWQIMAGARSLMFLSKTSSEEGYRRIKQAFNLHSRTPNNLLDQWSLLRDLANSKHFDQDWSCDVLFFTKKWIDRFNSQDHVWKALKTYFLEVAWMETAFLRTQASYDVVFSRALAEKNLRPNPYLVDTVRHLYLIGRGCHAGFKVATDDIAAPVSQFQKIFSEVYRLRAMPTMVHLGIINQENPNEPIYYSLESPTLINFSPKSRKASNKMNQLREIRHIQKLTTDYILSNKLGVENTPIYDFFNNISYEYYHSDVDKFKELRFSTEIPRLDDALIKEAKKFPNLPFCNASMFLRGCVRISVKESKNEDGV